MKWLDPRWVLASLLSLASTVYAQPREEHGTPGDDLNAKRVNEIVSQWRKQASDGAIASSQVLGFYQQVNSHPSCAAQSGKTSGACLDALLRHPARNVNLPAPASWAPQYDNSDDVGGNIHKKLEKHFSTALNEVATGLGMPATSGVLDDLQETALDSLIQLEDLEEPQTLGYRIGINRLGIVQPRLAVYATPQPELNPLLEKRLVAEGRANYLSSTEDGLELDDDYFVALDIGLLGPWFGRDLADHRLSRQALAETVIGDESMDYYRGAVAQLQLDDVLDRKALAYAAATLADFDGKVWNQIKESRLNQFWKLLHNQPQLTLRAKRLKRDDVVGADASSYRLWFGSGLANLTWLKLFSTCNHELANVDCPDAYQKWIDSWVLKHGVGVSAYYEWGDIADLSVELPPLPAGADGLPIADLLPDDLLGLGIDVNNPDRFVIDGGRYRRYGWAIGATITDPEIGRKNSSSLRADLAADYYRYHRDPVRLDHDVLRFTLTWRRGALSLPLHLMYRTETEFEANVDDKLAVGLGISYRH